MRALARHSWEFYICMYVGGARECEAREMRARSRSCVVYMDDGNIESVCGRGLAEGEREIDDEGLYIYW